MAQTLESPSGVSDDWEVLYVARGSSEVVNYRPIFTGDVFEDVPLWTPKGDKRTRTVLVLQHPCAMRQDSITLAKSILVAEVKPHSLLEPDKWQDYGKLMPLPDLFPEIMDKKQHQAAFFNNTYQAHCDNLTEDNRIACLSIRGVNLLFQRWIYHSSRFVVPTFDMNRVTSHLYEEIELIEEWCRVALENGKSIEEAQRGVADWLAEEIDGDSRRKRLENEQLRAQMRREVRKAAQR